MKTQQAIVSDSGWEAILVEDLEIRCDLPYQYREVIPPTPRPLTQYHTPGAKVTVREVWQYQYNEPVLDREWRTGNMNLPSFDAFKKLCQEDNANSRQAFEVVSEEESKKGLTANYGPGNDNYGRDKKPWEKTNSVEEAAVNYLIETFMDDDVNPDLLKSIYKYCANHIIQSGAYAKLHDIKTMMEYIEVPANKIEQFEKLFIHLKNKQ